MKLFFLLLSFTGLFATVNEPLRIEAFSGYRNDRIHWHLQEPGETGAFTYGEVYRDIEYWENGLTFKVVHRDISFFIRGAYGTFGKGTVTQRYPTTSATFDTEGWTADISGYMGYAVNLTADRTYKFILTPLIGYGGYFEQLTWSNQKFHLVWNGICFGVGITVEPGGPTVFNVGYSYNLLHNQVHSQTVKTSSGGNMGQTGWAQIDWLLGRYWRIGVGGDIHYFSTRVVDATYEDVSQKFKLRWVPFSAWLQISRSL